MSNRIKEMATSISITTKKKKKNRTLNSNSISLRLSPLLISLLVIIVCCLSFVTSILTPLNSTTTSTIPLDRHEIFLEKILQNITKTSTQLPSSSSQTSSSPFSSTTPLKPSSPLSTTSSAVASNVNRSFSIDDVVIAKQTVTDKLLLTKSAIIANSNSNLSLPEASPSIRNDSISNNRHNNFLLICSANSIDFWSTDCLVHQSRSLLSWTRPSSMVKHGFSGIAIWRPTFPEIKNDDISEMIWFDAYEYRFYHASIGRSENPSFACEDSILTIGNSEEMRIESNPFHLVTLSNLNQEKEKVVKLVVDNRNQLLIVSNLIQNRIDFYRLASNSDSVNSTTVVATAQWFVHLEASHPFDVVLDQDREEIFWIENYNAICRLNYNSLLDQQNKQEHQRNCFRNIPAEIVALTLNPLDSSVLFADKQGSIHIRSYGGLDWESSDKYRSIYQSELAIIGIHYNVMLDRLYINDQNEVQMFDHLSSEMNATSGIIGEQHPDKTILILKNIIFDLISFDVLNQNQQQQLLTTNHDDVIDFSANHSTISSIIPTTVTSTSTTTTTTTTTSIPITSLSTTTTEPSPVNNIPSFIITDNFVPSENIHEIQSSETSSSASLIATITALIFSVPFLLIVLFSLFLVILFYKIIWCNRQVLSKTFPSRFTLFGRRDGFGTLPSCTGSSNNNFSSVRNVNNDDVWARMGLGNGYSGGCDDDRTRLCRNDDTDTDDEGDNLNHGCGGEWFKGENRSSTNTTTTTNLNQPQYRRNILQNSNNLQSIANTTATSGDSGDIEDIFNLDSRFIGSSRGVSSVVISLPSPNAEGGEETFTYPLAMRRQKPPKCLACPDPEICQDKGICMTTYRIYQPPPPQ